MLASVALHSGSEEMLVTHAGVTEGYWREYLGEPKSARAAAVCINALIGTDEDTLFKTGQMLGDGPPNFCAGPLWASAAGELIPSWANSNSSMPFSQVHGHSTVIDWATGRLPKSFAHERVMTFDTEAAHELTMLSGGKRIIGIDPGHDVAPHLPWRALELGGYEVTS
jgi:hypothetical protein